MSRTARLAAVHSGTVLAVAQTVHEKIKGKKRGGKRGSHDSGTIGLLPPSSRGQDPLMVFLFNEDTFFSDELNLRLGT